MSIFGRKNVSDSLKAEAIKLGLCDQGRLSTSGNVKAINRNHKN